MIKANKVWYENSNEYVNVEISKDRFVCVKSVPKKDGLTYILKNKEGSMVFDQNHQYIPEYPFDAESVLSEALKALLSA